MHKTVALASKMRQLFVLAGLEESAPVATTSSALPVAAEAAAAAAAAAAASTPGSPVAPCSPVAASGSSSGASMVGPNLLNTITTQ